MLSSITSIQQVQPKVFIIALANGQVWRQEGTQITVFIRPGDEARIEKGFMGSYRLTTSSIGTRNWVRVTRIQ